MALIQLALPVIVLAAFIAFKLDHKQKGYLFKIPLLVSSTALSLVIGHMAGGVMGFYAAALCDLMLYPIMLLMKKAWNWNEKRKQRKQNWNTGSMYSSLPRYAAVQPS